MAIVAAIIAKIGAAEAQIQSTKFSRKLPDADIKSSPNAEKLNKTEISTGTKIKME